MAAGCDCESSVTGIISILTQDKKSQFKIIRPTTQIWREAREKMTDDETDNQNRRLRVL
jgi:hypothetical protein